MYLGYFLQHMLVVVVHFSHTWTAGVGVLGRLAPHWQDLGPYSPAVAPSGLVEAPSGLEAAPYSRVGASNGLVEAPYIPAVAVAGYPTTPWLETVLVVMTVGPGPRAVNQRYMVT